jgi:hypothetical protein
MKEQESYEIGLAKNKLYNACVDLHMAQEQFSAAMQITSPKIEDAEVMVYDAAVQLYLVQTRFNAVMELLRAYGVVQTEEDKDLELTRHAL